MKKTIIRLTEQDLHGIIRDCINEALNEADWKLFVNSGKQENDNAEKFRQEKSFLSMSPEERNKYWAMKARAAKFFKAGRDAFNRDFGYKTSDDKYGKNLRQVKLGGDFNSTEEFAPHVQGARRDEFGNDYKEFPHGVYTTERTPEDFFKGDEGAVQAYNKAKEEWNNYTKGNYKYDKGWKLKK